MENYRRAKELERGRRPAPTRLGTMGEEVPRPAFSRQGISSNLSLVAARMISQRKRFLEMGAERKQMWWKKKCLGDD